MKHRSARRDDRPAWKRYSALAAVGVVAKQRRAGFGGVHAKLMGTPGLGHEPKQRRYGGPCRNFKARSRLPLPTARPCDCLLYTSDAADDLYTV